MQLQRDVNNRIQELGGRSANARKVIQALYTKPIMNAEDMQKVTELTLPSVYSLIRDLEDLNILQEITGGQRGRKYIFREYVDLFL
ncbi:MAG: hypothetical protein U5J95_12260 [Balneolaceae bacterium]|nr:hypothetical protein [Balneolaceae bacterium]